MINCVDVPPRVGFHFSSNRRSALADFPACISDQSGVTGGAKHTLGGP